MWDDSLPTLTWILLNPSTADEHSEDPTIRRVIGLSRGWGFGSAKVLNVYARICTCSTELEQNFSERERIGQRNDKHLAQAKGATIVAWGAHGFATSRADNILERLPAPLYCLGINRDHSPKHPLYARNDSSLIPFRLKP